MPLNNSSVKRTKRETAGSVRFSTQSNSRIPRASSVKKPSATPRKIRDSNVVNKVLQFSPVATPGRGSTMKEPSAKDPIKVFLRIRPLTRDEQDKGEVKTIHASEDQLCTVKTPLDSQAFRLYGESESNYSFHKVWDETAGQQQVFDDTAKGLVDEVFAGRNGIIFAYGITKSGKTHSILGNSKMPGIMPRSLEYIFSRINSDSSKDSVEKAFSKENFDPEFAREIEADENDGSVFHEYKVSCSYVEVYNEQVYDLLAVHEEGKNGKRALPKDLGKTKRPFLQLKENQHGAVFVKGLTKVDLSSANHGNDVLAKGQVHRQIAETNANRDSSRSHTIFTVTITRTTYDKQQAILAEDDRVPNRIRNTKLMIIDLAGSERPGRTRAQGERLREAAIINTSLMTLGRCFEALRWNQTHSKAAQKVVPYRDSKLTRMFNDPLNNGRAVMIVNVDPCASNYEETVHTLKYAALAREIQTVSRIDHGQKIHVPQPQNLPKTPGGTKKRLSDVAVEELEKMETRESTASSIMSYDELLEMYDQVATKLVDTEAQMASLEMNIREETAKEMAEALQEQADQFQQLMDQQKIADELNYAEKVDEWTKKREHQERENERNAYISELERQVASDNREHQDLRQYHAAQLALVHQEKLLLQNEIERISEELVDANTAATEAAIQADNALKDKTDAWEGMIAQTEEEHQQLVTLIRQERDGYRNDLEKAQQDLASLQSSYDSLQDQYKKAEEQMKQDSADFAQREKIFTQESAKRYNTLEDEYESAKSSLNATITDLESKLSETTTHAESVQASFADERAVWESEKAGFADQICVFEAQISDANDIAARLRQEIAEAGESVQAAEASAKASIAELEKSHKSEIASIEKAHHADMTDVKKTYESDISQIQKSHKAEGNEMKKAHKAELSRINSEHKKEVKQINAKHSDEMKSTIAGHKEAIASVEETLQTTTNNLKSVEDSKVQLEGTVTDLQKQVKTLEAQAVEREEEIVEEKVAFQQEIDEAHEKNADLMAKLNEEIERVADIKDEVFKAKLESNEKSQIIDDLQKEIGKHEGTEQAVQHLQEQVSTMVPRAVHEQKVEEALKSVRKPSRRSSKRKSDSEIAPPSSSKRGRFNIQTGDKRMGVDTIDVDTLVLSEDEDTTDSAKPAEKETPSATPVDETEDGKSYQTRARARKGLSARNIINVPSPAQGDIKNSPMQSPAKRAATGRLTRGAARLFQGKRAQVTANSPVTRTRGFTGL